MKFRFLYVTDSTLNPIVGIVVTTSPICTACQQVSLRLELGVKRLSYFESVKKGCLASVVLDQNHQQREPGLWHMHLRTKPKISILISFFAHRRPESHDMP